MYTCSIFHSCTLSLLFVILFTANIFPQVQITLQEFEKLIAPNTSHYFTEPTMGNFNIGNTGGPNTYDFSFINLDNMLISNTYQVSTIPIIAARYPAEATVFGESPATVEKNPVFYVSNDSLYITGDASLIPEYRFKHYRPYQLNAVFPVTYGSGFNWNVTIYDTTYNSNWQVQETNIGSSQETTIIDGYGTLKLPNGNFECLRVKREYVQNEGGDKEYLFMTRDGILLMVGGVDPEAPDTGVVLAGMQLLIDVALVDVKDDVSGTIDSYWMGQNYPNPFNPSTVIDFNLPEEGFVSLTVYNSLGEEKAELLNGILSAGRHSITFNASEYPSGVYFYQLRSGSYSAVKKMILLK